MCHYITLIARTDDVDGLRAVMKAFGRTAAPVANPSIGKMLLAGERQFLTAVGCDCGTVLGSGAEDAAQDRAEVEAARLARKGWSRAKIERAMAASQRAASRPKTRARDSVELWADVLGALESRLGLPQAGLVVHAYSGSLDDEVFDVGRREAGAMSAEGLGAMREDEVTTFRMR